MSDLSTSGLLPADDEGTLQLKILAQSFPEHPGVYLMKDAEGAVIYVGKAKNIKKRVSSYFLARQSEKTQALVRNAKQLEFMMTRTEGEAFLLENNLIKEYQPKYNIILKDDKSYPYLGIDLRHRFPTLKIYRPDGQRSKNKISQILYFGPYSNVKQLRESSDWIYKIFQLRSCSDAVFKNRIRPCLQYQIKRCSAPCVGYISEADYKKEVDLLIDFLQGQDHQILEFWKDKMQTASQSHAYEAAVLYRDKIQSLRTLQKDQVIYNHCGNLNVVVWHEDAKAQCLGVTLLKIRQNKLMGNQHYFANLKYSPDSFDAEAFKIQYAEPGVEIVIKNVNEKPGKNISIEQKKLFEIAKINLEKALHLHIEKLRPHLHRWEALEALLGRSCETMLCVDVSHHLGEATVASFVVFDRNGPVRKAYRKMKIETDSPGNDCVAMFWALEQYLTRAMVKDAQALPSVICVDGGRGQLLQAFKVCEKLGVDCHEDVQLLGIAKGIGRKEGLEKVYRWPENQALDFFNNSPAFLLLQHIRDEAHRFALGYHQQQKNKNRLVSVLDWIPGIGREKKKLLLGYFGGLEFLKQASLEELTRVPGISQTLAERIYETLKNQNNEGSP